ncbi:hypothetical protein [Paenibacillus cymbidii]|uniref:hypothetical protein n=1 Tax=Paenibacillus cymbidii TaxID=1639034 RepID=UPI00108039A4|nr:hypothetical protein [Paenibacillus cymbidii]
MHRLDKVKFTLFYGKMPETACYGYMESDREGGMVALYNQYGEEIDLYGGHEFVRVRSLGKFDDEDRDNFYSLLESDGVG